MPNNTVTMADHHHKHGIRVSCQDRVYYNSDILIREYGSYIITRREIWHAAERVAGQDPGFSEA